MIRLWLGALALMLTVGCHRHETEAEKHERLFNAPAPADGDARFVARIRKDIEGGETVFDREAEHVRAICNTRKDLADCAYVLPKLPAPLPRP